MTALTSNYEDKRQDGDIISVKVKSSAIIYKGAMLVDKGTGYAEPGVDGSGYIFLGIAVENVTGGASDGAVSVRVYKNGTFQIPKASAVQTDLDQVMYLHDDNSVGTSSTNSVAVGTCVDIVDGSTIKLRIDNYTK